MKIFIITVLLVSLLCCHGEATSVFSVFMEEILECLEMMRIVDTSASRVSDVEVLKLVLRDTGYFKQYFN